MKILDITLRFYDDAEPKPACGIATLLPFSGLIQGVLGLRQIGLAAEMKAVELLKAADALPPGWEPERTGMIAVATDDQLKELVNDPDWHKLSPEDQVEMRSRFQFVKNHIDTRDLMSLRAHYAATDHNLPPAKGEESLSDRAYRVVRENIFMKTYIRTLRKLWGTQAECPALEDVNTGEEHGPVCVVFFPSQANPNRDDILRKTAEFVGIPIEDLFEMYTTGALSVMRPGGE